MVTKKKSPTQRTILGYELDPKQDVYVNYLCPTVAACLLYIFLFATDLVLAYRHYCDENPIWSFLTLLFMYVPVVGCLILTISSWDLWPEEEGCGWENIKWALVKIVEHAFFAIWSMWRYAERIFWSIEALRSEDDEESRKECLEKVTAPRTIELYFFLQGFLQAIPQVLLQLHILMRNVNDLSGETIAVQVASMALNLTKLSITTTLYHRFKSQKIAGKQYPWLKPYKLPYDTTIDSARRVLPPSQPPPARLLVRRSSSDLYLQPVDVNRETSIVDGPPRTVFRAVDEADFFRLPKIVEVKGLPDDDMAGKIIAFCWWFCFLLARMLAISAFAYFYPTDVIWLLVSHFVLVVALLVYDVRADEVRRNKAIFFIFIGLVYLFCLIEFKIKFKKTKFIYNGFFALVFTENIVMSLVWWCANLETVESDWWFKYIIYLIVCCTGLSLISMLFYLKVNKPEKVVVERIAVVE